MQCDITSEKSFFFCLVSQVDNMASNGIDFMQKKWPAVQESKDQVRMYSRSVIRAASARDRDQIMG